MNSMLTQNNLVTAAVVGGATILAGRFLAKKSAMIRGIATVAVVAAAIPLGAQVAEAVAKKAVKAA